MLLVAFALLIVVVLALAISADAGALIGLTQEQTGGLIIPVILLVLLASALVGGRYRLGEVVRNFLIWIGIGAILAVGYVFRGDLSIIGDRLMGELQPGAAIVDPATGNVEIRRGYGGSFIVNTALNGAHTQMIFDTGATAVVLTSADARAAGIDTTRLSYSVPVQTANGTGFAAPIVLDEISVGNITRNRVRAFVLQEGVLDTSLLGMTFLETLSRYSVSGDTLEMHN